MRMLRRLAGLASVALLLAACATVPPPASPPPPGMADAVAAWGRVLERHVDGEGRVDFRGLEADRADLDRYVAFLAATGPAKDPALLPSRAAVLAHHVNAYNALAMYNVLAAGRPETLAGLRKVRFFYLTRMTIAGEAVSLYDYENDVILPLGEERVHFALNCMVAGCPRLPREPFRAETLDEVLDRETRRFLAEPRNVRVDHGRRTVALSSILDFYTQDFLAKAPSLIAYLNRYREEQVPEDYKVEFIPYDWTVNQAPTRQAGA